MRFSEIPSAQEIRLLLEKAEQEGLDASIIERLKVILHFAEHRQSISALCRHFGISRSTFHRWMERFDPQDVRSLQDKSREAVYIRRTTLAEEIVELIRRYRLRYPHMGKEKIAALLRAEHGVDVSLSAIGRMIERECFYFADTPLHWKKRMASGLGLGLGRSQESRIKSQEEGLGLGPNPNPGSLLWKPLLRFAFISSLITNLAFIAMLLSMSLFERAQKAREKSIQALPPVIESQENQPIHAAPLLRSAPQSFEEQASYAPMP